HELDRHSDPVPFLSDAPFEHVSHAERFGNPPDIRVLALCSLALSCPTVCGSNNSVLVGCERAPSYDEDRLGSSAIRPLTHFDKSARSPRTDFRCRNTSFSANSATAQAKISSTRSGSP